jgi:translation initiation factor 2 alpha subunit (eIF-2alpha)
MPDLELRVENHEERICKLENDKKEIMEKMGIVETEMYKMKSSFYETSRRLEDKFDDRFDAFTAVIIDKFDKLTNKALDMQQNNITDSKKAWINIFNVVWKVLSSILLMITTYYFAKK